MKIDPSINFKRRHSFIEQIRELIGQTIPNNLESQLLHNFNPQLSELQKLGLNLVKFLPSQLDSAEFRNFVLAGTHQTYFLVNELPKLLQPDVYPWLPPSQPLHFPPTYHPGNKMSLLPRTAPLVPPDLLSRLIIVAPSPVPKRGNYNIFGSVCVSPKFFGHA